MNCLLTFFSTIIVEYGGNYINNLDHVLISCQHSAANLDNLAGNII